MKSKPLYGFIGLIIGAVVDLIIHLIAGGLHEGLFKKSFNKWSLIGLAALAIVGLLLGMWLGGEVPVLERSSDTSKSMIHRSSQNARPVTITRLHSLLSSLKLRGPGISLEDVKTRGSRLDIDTRDEDR
jgi:H+/Cl- antiporter ClcA